MPSNRRVILAERPRYIVPTANCFRVVAAPDVVPGPGQLLIRTQYLSMDVMLYSRVQKVPGDVEPIPLDQVMTGPAVGIVEIANHPDYEAGDQVSGYWAWQERVLSDGSRLRKLDFGVQKPSYGVSAYGASSFGAYVALKVLAPPVAGETVVVGTALGGLGHVAGQIARLKGCRVVGIAGSAEKCRIAVEQFGFAACVDHSARDFAAQLRAACPNGIDVYIDTIGGKAFDAVMPLLNLRARIAACGLMDTPHLGETAFQGRYSNTMNVLHALIGKRLSLRGLVVFDHLQAELQNFHADMKAWIDAGQVKPLEDIVNGLDAAPAAFNDVFMGRNRGKRLIKVAD